MHYPTHYDTYGTKYTQIQTDEANLNWVFLPGGPGVQSDYFIPLIEHLTLPGNVYLIDLPNNGNNHTHDVDTYDFEQWKEIFLSAMHQFDQPILVGHSFGGMFPLLFPQLETLLKGLVILNSAPVDWRDAAIKVATERNLPSFAQEMEALMLNPCEETGLAAILACAPYYFRPDKVQTGIAMLQLAIFNPRAVMWWQQRVAIQSFSAQWIPQNVPTLVVGGEWDSMTPFSIFENDHRFKRPNIYLHLLKEAGHFPWIEDMQAVKELFQNFITHQLVGATTEKQMVVS